MALVSSPSDSEEKTLVFNQTVSNQHSSVSKEAGSIAIHILNDAYSYPNDDGLNTHGIAIYPLYKQVNNSWIPVRGGEDFIRLTSTSGDISVRVHTTQRGATGYQLILGRALYTMIVPPAQRSVSLKSAQHIVLHTLTEFPGVKDYVQAKYTSTVALTGKIDAQLVAQGSNRIVLEASGKQMGERVVEGWTQQAESILLSAQARLTLIGRQNEIITQAPVADRRFVLNISNGQIPSGENLLLVATHGHNLVSINTDAVVENNQSGHYPIIEAIRLYGQSRVKMLSEQENNIIQVGNKDENPVPYGEVGHVVGILSTNTKEISGPPPLRYAGNMLAQAKNNIISIYAPNAQSKYAIRATAAADNPVEGNILLTAAMGDNFLWLDNQVISSAGAVYGIVAENQSKISLVSPDGNNQIQLGDEDDEQHEGYTGQSVGLYSAKSAIYLNAQTNQLMLHSPKSMRPVAIYAVGSYVAPNVSLNATDTNTIYSLSRGIAANTQAKVALNATNTNQIEAGSTAITSRDKANVQLSAGKMNNISAGNTALLTATEGQITIDGPVNIQAPLAADAKSSSEIAIHYEKNSQIQGNLRATDKGLIDVRSKGSTMTLTGDSMAMNQGVINLQLTPGSILTGRVDNSSAYPYADYQRLFMSASSADTLPEAAGVGYVNLSLANNTIWNMTGQSWVSHLGGSGGIINLRAVSDGEVTARGRALHMDVLSGKQAFLMNLNKDNYQQSDMLYIKQGTTDEQTLLINNIEALQASMQVGERVRFATVQRSQNEFREGKIYYWSDEALFDQTLRVHYENRQSASEQDQHLNSMINGDGLNLDKPGDAYVKVHYEEKDAQNVYLVKQKSTSPSRPAEVAVKSMPRLGLNYASQLDTYAKREGLRAYANPEQRIGMWIRAMRFGLQDQDAFSIHGNEYEIGVDRFTTHKIEKQHKWGISYTYGTVAGEVGGISSSVHIRKHMLSLYNTNQYNAYQQNAYYNDNVFRIGEIHQNYRSMRANGSIWGKADYKQYFVSLSTEHGYRKFLDKSKSWYITPQVQLQYTYLKGKHYATSHNVSIRQGGTSSLIGRLGTDIVKVLDSDTQSRVYARVSVLREFLGDIKIDAGDYTGRYHDTLKTKGTWASVGAGFSVVPSKNTYIFLDGERVFGAHHDGYNFRLGISWRFH